MLKLEKYISILITFIILQFVICDTLFARSYGSLLCKKESYHCVKVKSGQSWKSLFPDENERDIVMRVNRLNIRLYGGMVLAVPNNLSSVDVLDLAPFPRKANDVAEKLIVVDPAQLAWGAYDDNGALVKWGPLSAGKDYCPDIESECRTGEGNFRIVSLGSSDCKSKKFPVNKGGAPMPYCMFFHGGQALHGSPGGLVGYNASHGCVRMNVNDAEWLRYDFVEAPNTDNDYRGTRVIVRPYADEG